MPNSKMEASLFCVHCGEDTEHVISYKNNHIHQVACKSCGVEVNIDQDYVKKHFKEEFVLRVLTKPVRITREMERDLTGFLVSLPFRVVTKPYRVFKEFQDKK